MEQKPNVFPQKMTMEEAMAQANETGTKIAEQAAQEMGIKHSAKSAGELAAEEQMKRESLEKL